MISTAPCAMPCMPRLTCGLPRYIGETGMADWTGMEHRAIRQKSRGFGRQWNEWKRAAAIPNRRWCSAGQGFLVRGQRLIEGRTRYPSLLRE